MLFSPIESTMDTSSRLSYEYQQKVKNYTPYESPNIQIVNYNEIRRKTENKKTKEISFEVVTQKTKVKPDDVLVLVYNDKSKFFSSNDNLATGYIEESTYRDTIFFDHLHKVALIARRKVVPYQQSQPNIIAEASRTSEFPTATGAGFFNKDVVESVQKYCDFKLNKIKDVVDEIEQIEQKKPKKKTRSKKEPVTTENQQVNFEPKQ